jgi:tetratricopeptide (TPR) repeat protein
MKSVRSHDPVRWRDREVDAHALEARAALLADAARAEQPLGEQALARIRAEVLEPASERRGFFELRRFPVVARLAVGLALVLVCAATADGAGILWRKYVRTARTSGQSAPPAAATPPQAPRRPHRATASNDEALLPDAPLETVPAPVPPLAPDDVGLHQPSQHPLRHVGAPEPASGSPALERASASPAPAISPLAPRPTPALAEVPNAQPTKATEAGMVAEALSQLRQQGDPRAALSALDAYARAFPHGVLEKEALRTRLEADIRLDDRKAALVLLDAMPDLSDEPGTDLLLTRAELRAAAGRYREALADFTQVQKGEGERGAPVASERALYGRAVCLGHLHEDDRARADLLAYERRFPGGRFAIEVRRLLSEPAPARRP